MAGGGFFDARASDSRVSPKRCSIPAGSSRYGWSPQYETTSRYFARASSSLLAAEVAT